MWWTLFRDTLSLFIFVFVLAFGVLVCVALVNTQQFLWVPLAVATTAVLCKLALEIMA